MTAFLGGGGGGGSVAAASEHGRVRLIKSGADLLLNPHDGNSLIIDGSVEVVPSAGVTLAATGLTIDTDHFIYAFMSGSTMTLEASTTGHATDSTTGVEIKSGDSTRTLVGMARPITGPVWADTTAQRFVISWFNRRIVSAVKVHASSISTSTTTEIEISAANHRAEWLTWADEAVVVLLSAVNRNDAAGQWTLSRAYIDTTAVSELFQEAIASGNHFNGFANVGASDTGIAEGYHFSTVQVRLSGGTTAFGPFRNTTLIKG